MTIEQRLVDYYALLNVARTVEAGEIAERIVSERRTWRPRTVAGDATRRAEAETRMGHLEEARETLLDTTRRAEYDRVLAAQAPNGTPEPRSIVPIGSDGTDLLDRAWAAIARGDYFAAAYLARQATEKLPASDQAWSARASANAGCGRMDPARYEVGEAINLRPDDPRHHMLLGNIEEMSGRPDEAIEAYEAAVRISPGDPEPRMSMAVVYGTNGRMDRALQILEGLHNEHPDLPAVTDTYAAALLDMATSVPKRYRPAHAESGPTTRFIVSADEIERMRALLDKADRLEISDPQLTKNRGNLRDKVEGDARVVFRLSRLFGGWATFCVFCLVFMAPAAGSSHSPGWATVFVIAGLLAGLIAGLVVYRPEYKHNARLVRLHMRPVR